MVKPTVVWTATAVKQRREIFKYWTERNGSPTYAKKLLAQIKKRINILLLNYPETSVKTNLPDTHMAALGNYSLFFKYADNHIIIMAFWDNRQDPEKLRKLLS